MDVRFSGNPSVLSLIRAGDMDLAGTNNELALSATVATVSPIRRQSEGAGDIDVRLTAQLQRVDDGWLYQSGELRAGTPFTLRTGKYEVRGSVTAIHAPSGGAGGQNR
jgi:hypothetical protein